MGQDFLWLPRRLGGKQTQTKLPRHHRNRRREYSCRSPISQPKPTSRSVRQGSASGDLVLRRRNHSRNRPALLIEESAIVKTRQEENDMLAIKPDGKKKVTFTDLLICGVLGAAWLPLGIAAAAGIGGYKYWQSKTEKWSDEYRRNQPEEDKKLKS